MISAKSAIAFLCLGLSSTISAQTYALRAARIFDSATGQISSPGLVVVASGKIQQVGGTAPAGAEVVDLGDATLMPGFIDAHTHLTMDFNSDYNGAALKPCRRPVAEKAIRATANARKTLMAGFTTVRDVGRRDFIDVGLRNAINSRRDSGAAHAGRGACAGVHRRPLRRPRLPLSDCSDRETGPEDGVINSARRGAAMPSVSTSNTARM